jgi:CRP-like cAMP-binding protein
MCRYSPRVRQSATVPYAERLDTAFYRRTFRLGEEIVREGSVGGSIYIIRRGEVSVELAATSSRTVVAWLGPDDMCGEMAFLARGNASAAVVAKDEPVEADEIEAKALRETFEAFPGLAPASTNRWPWCWRGDCGILPEP